MPTAKTVFVLIHGGWHNHTVWNKVSPLLEARGFTVVTPDLPAAGVHAVNPVALDRQPFDPVAFASERSAHSERTQEERTNAVVALVKASVASGATHVVLVGHSAAGMTVSAVAEHVPHLLAAVVYLAGFMVPKDATLLSMVMHETLSAALSPRLFVGDTAAIGATRINARSRDDSYQSLLKAAFYGDLSDSDFLLAAAQLHCDESNAAALAKSDMTRERFGTVPRHYIRCTQDCAVPLAGQDHMVASVDATLGSKTMTHTLASSHSPFLSQPHALSEILIDIAAQCADQRSVAAR